MILLDIMPLFIVVTLATLVVFMDDILKKARGR